jgi:class 3 adenylate cyclase
MADILIVDDEPSARRTAALLLEKRGHRVRAAEGVASAMDALAGAAFDVVVTDLRMPDGVGLDVLREVKARSPETHVILLTAHPGWETAKESIRLGALDYLEKAQEPEELFRRIDAALEARTRRAGPAGRPRDALEGRRRVLTVLFADLRGSLELIAAGDLDQARRTLDGVLRAMMDAVHEAGGLVNQVLGDGIMALFGAEDAGTHHARAACLGALAMHERVGRLAARLGPAGREARIRVGINSGEVLLRSIETDLGRDYTALGPTTHIAARMEQLARPGSTLITAEARRLAGAAAVTRPVGWLDVKGLAGGVEAFELLGESQAGARASAGAA